MDNSRQFQTSSNSTLINIYQSFMKSPTFVKQVDKVIAQEQELGLYLQDTLPPPDKGPAFYSPVKHAIVVYGRVNIVEKPEKESNKDDLDALDALLDDFDQILDEVKQETGRSDGQVKTREAIIHDLFFELLNASKWTVLQPLYDKTYGPEQKEQTAARALAIEWVEWRNAAENVVLIKKMQQEIGFLQLPLTNLFEEEFKEGSWLSFKPCLLHQIKRGHTNHYDSDAQTNDWKGLGILDGVEKSNNNGESEALFISKEELFPTENTQEPYLKPKKNPFLTFL